jgi:hypothetical protein
VRDVCFSLYEQLRLSDEPFVVVEALRCVQQFILFSSKQISIPELVPSLKSMMHSPQLLLRKAATICLWQLVQREAAAVSAAGHDIEEQLFLELDRETDRQLPEDVRDVIVGLLKALAPSNPSRWLALCRSIISQTTAESAAAASGRADDVDAEGDDDEERGEPKAPAPARNAPQARTPEADAGAGTILASPRWRTKVFALKCLRLVLQVLGDHAEQFDLILARDRKASGDNTEFLVYRVAELIRTAFSAATSPVDELRLGGLKALQDIVEVRIHLLSHWHSQCFILLIFLSSHSVGIASGSLLPKIPITRAISCWSSTRHRSVRPWHRPSPMIRAPKSLHLPAMSVLFTSEVASVENSWTCTEF